MIHKEGIGTLIIVAIVLVLVNIIVYFTAQRAFLVSLIVSVLFLLFFMQFFRKSSVRVSPDAKKIYSPADGQIVAIEEYDENEYFKGRRIKISVFMSVWNAHVNWIPVPGIISYYKYHPGKYLVAFYPKSSELNERATTVIKMENGKEVLLRQIAGALARRIVTYTRPGDVVVQNQEMGYIKFGSRVDIFLPLGTKVMVSMNERVTGNKTLIALVE